MCRILSVFIFLLILASTANATPARVQGCAAEAGANNVSCTLTGVVSGHLILVGGAGLNGVAAFVASDNCGGTYVTVDSSQTTSTAGQAYSTGSHGTCAITVTVSDAGATTITAEEITAGTAAQHNYVGNQSVTAGNTIATSVTTTAIDYVFSWATDAGALGGAVTIISPFTLQDSQGTFPIGDADATQSSSGLITATWNHNVTTTQAAQGVMAFSTPAGGAVTPALMLRGFGR